MSFHPDGLIVAGGNEDKNVIVWDVKNQQADLLSSKNILYILIDYVTMSMYIIMYML